MPVLKAARVIGGLVAAIAALGMAVSAEAQEKKIKIGVIYDLTGPLAGGGSELQYTGAKIMLDSLRQEPESRATRSRRSTPTPRASPTSPSTRRSG